MTTEAEQIGRLVDLTYLALAPAPVPPHRSLDIACVADRSQTASTIFCDAFWTQPGRFACCAIRIGGGPIGRLGAHAFKAILRAAVRTHPADRALALGVRAFAEYGPDLTIDAAVASMSTRDGTASVGTRGSGTASHFAAGAARRVAMGGQARIGRGEALRLSVGGTGRIRPIRSADAADVLRAVPSGGTEWAAAAVVLRDYSEGGAGTFVLANDVAEISPLLAEVRAYLAERGVAAAVLETLELALDELLTNVVLYAYRDGGSHEIVVDVRAEGDGLRFEIRDDGIPFDPTSLPPPDLSAGLDERPLGGLGLHLARTVFDAIGYRRTQGWNVLVLSKSLAGGPT